MIDYSEYLEGYRDAQAYDVEEGGYDEDYPLTEQWARSLGGPLHFLTRADQEALLARVREHLHPQGCFLFGTRNPSPRNLFEARYAEPQKYTMPDGRHYVVTERQVYDPITQIQHYTFLNQWLHPDGQQEEKTLRSALRYVFPQEMEALLFYNGFEIHSCYGSWQQEPLTSTSRYMIYVCQRRV